MTNDAWVVTMPKLGETVTEGTVNAWLKQVGDQVAFDDPLFEVSTDKVDSEIPSPYDGKVLEILVEPGETVPVGTPLVRIGDPSAAADSAPSTAAPPVPATVNGSSADTGNGSRNDATAAMALFEVTMPKLGETVTEGTVNAWLKQVGDQVAFDDPLFEVSTDKVDSEIPSPYDGTVVEILVPAGDTVPVGTPLVRIGDPSAAAPGATEPGATQAGVTEPGATAGPPAAEASAHAAAGPGAVTTSVQPGARPQAATGGAAPMSPVVRRLAAEHGIDLSQVPGTGVGGRIRREDVQKAVAGNGSTPSRPVPPPGPQAARVAAAAPAAAPAAVPAPAGAAPAAPAAARPTAPVAGSTDPRDEIVPLSRMRQITADLMVRSLNTSAHVWTSVEVDFEAIEVVRRRHKDRFRKETGAALSYLPFVCRAVCEALRAFPAVNASIDVEAKTMTLHPYVNLGIAVDLDEQGLVAPVVKDADALNIRGVASRVAGLAAAARNRKLTASDMSGSTFTITNPGPFSSYASSPVINQPNVAILCTDGVTRRPVAVGEAIAIHAIGIIGLVYDHRAFDGSTASKFLLHLRDSLQDRNWEAEVT